MTKLTKSLTLTVVLLLIVIESGFAAKIVSLQPVKTKTAQVVTEKQPAQPATPPQTELLPATTPSLAPQTGEQINWWVVASGGGTSTVGTYVLGSTIGQTAVGTSSVGSYQLHSGFWQNFTTNQFQCGDADGSGQVDISDVVYMVSYVFGTGQPPLDVSGGDVDCSGHFDLSDAVYLVAYVFGTGPAPCHGPLCVK